MKQTDKMFPVYPLYENLAGFARSSNYGVINLQNYDKPIFEKLRAIDSKYLSSVVNRYPPPLPTTIKKTKAASKVSFLNPYHPIHPQNSIIVSNQHLPDQWQPLTTKLFFPGIQWMPLWIICLRVCVYLNVGLAFYSLSLFSFSILCNTYLFMYTANKVYLFISEKHLIIYRWPNILVDTF